MSKRKQKMIQKGLGSVKFIRSERGAEYIYRMRKFINSLLLHGVIIGNDDELCLKHGKEKKKVQSVLLKNYWLEPR